MAKSRDPKRNPRRTSNPNMHYGNHSHIGLGINASPFNHPPVGRAKAKGKRSETKLLNSKASDRKLNKNVRRKLSTDMNTHNNQYRNNMQEPNRKMT
eukprot:UN17758